MGTTKTPSPLASSSSNDRVPTVNAQPHCQRTAPRSCTTSSAIIMMHTGCRHAEVQDQGALGLHDVLLRVFHAIGASARAAGPKAHHGRVVRHHPEVAVGRQILHALPAARASGPGQAQKKGKRCRCKKGSPAQPGLDHASAEAMSPRPLCIT